MALPNASSNTEQQNHKFLTLTELLNTDQPYKEFKRLDKSELDIPGLNESDNDAIRRIQGSLVGLAVGDALGASVEFRPNAYLQQNKVTDMQSGGTWGLAAGQWTDDTSMALCLAASLIVKQKSNSYDQFVRYKRWYRDGYMSSTGKCFDIGKSTREAIIKFESHQEKVRKKNNTGSDEEIEKEMNKECPGLKYGTLDSAGNGPLMRLAPLPCFFFHSYEDVTGYINTATQLTHDDRRASDACLFYAGLIWHALHNVPKEELLCENFYKKFVDKDLHKDIMEIAKGSYKRKNGYEDGIRGKGYVVNALEAALWAFHNDGGKFDKGVLAAVNLGDDTDTTAAIYGQLAGAVYGIDSINPQWIKQLFQGEFIKAIAKGLYLKGPKPKNGQQWSEWDNESDTTRLQHGKTDTKPDGSKTGESNTTRFAHPQSTNVDGASGPIKPPHMISES